MLSNLVFTLLSLFFILGSVFLVLVILIQKPQGGGLSAAFGAGGGASQTAFGAKTGDVLTIVTVGIFVFFLVVSSVLVRVSDARYSSNQRMLAPVPPTELSGVAESPNVIRITWNDMSDNEEGFIVERSTSTEGPFMEVREVAADETMFLDSELADNTAYSYRVLAQNEIGISSPSDVVTITTPTAPAEEQPPSEGDGESPDVVDPTDGGDEAPDSGSDAGDSSGGTGAESAANEGGETGQGGG